MGKEHFCFFRKTILEETGSYRCDTTLSFAVRLVRPSS